MALTDALIPEFDHEMATTRKLLDRVPDGKLAWKPHEKSMTLGRLASHLAELPGWNAAILGQSSFDLAAAEQSGARGASLATRAEILALFDKNVAAARGAIASKSDAEYLAPWSLKRGGHELFTMPKVSVVRNFLLNHMIHHRGQLSVYLRMQDVPLPAIYGPSADEAM